MLTDVLFSVVPVQSEKEVLPNPLWGAILLYHNLLYILFSKPLSLLSSKLHAGFP